MVINKYEARARLGRSAELRFMADAFDGGLIVYAPVQSCPHVDCLVDNGSRVFRVQVKAATPHKHVCSTSGVAEPDRYYFNRGGRGQLFDGERFDVLAALCADTRDWVFVSAKAVHGKNAVSIPCVRVRAPRSTTLPWTDWTIFTGSGSHQPAHQLTRHLLQPSPEL